MVADHQGRQHQGRVKNRGQLPISKNPGRSPVSGKVCFRPKADIGDAMKQREPKTPSELLEQLRSLFPGFDEDSKEGHASNNLTFHAVLMDFRPFYSGHVSDFSEKQLKALASVVNVAAEKAGTLANAFDTCFFERMGRQSKPLRTFLSPQAKDLSRGHR